MAKREVVDVGIHERGLFMVDGDPKECDFCDEKKVCASINTITIDVICVCEDCLLNFIKAFHPSPPVVKMPTTKEGISHCAKSLMKRKGLVNIPVAYTFGFKDCMKFIKEFK